MSDLTERISCKLDAGAYSHTNDVSALVIALEEAERDLAAARAEVERERLRLAACGVAAMGNTEAMVADRLTPEHPYYSASYRDVCSAVDREMAHRAEAARLQSNWDAMKEWALENHVNGMWNTMAALEGKR